MCTVSLKKSYRSIQYNAKHTAPTADTDSNSRCAGKIEENVLRLLYFSYVSSNLVNTTVVPYSAGLIK